METPTFGAGWWRLLVANIANSEYAGNAGLERQRRAA
jgi:hypothetical protein